MVIWSSSKRLRTAFFFSCVWSLAACSSDSAATPDPAPGTTTGSSQSPAAAGATAAAGAGAGAPSASAAGRTGAAGAIATSGGAAGVGAAGQSAAGGGGAAGGSSGGGTSAAGSSSASAAGSGGAAGVPEAGAAATGGASGAPVASAAGVGGGPAGGAAAEAGAASLPPREDLGEGDGKDVITIGDSWMSNTLGTGDAIQGAMQRLTMQPYRHYAVQGVMLLSASAFGAAIPSQYDQAKRANPDIKTVLITAGGNDIIQNPAVQASCNEGGQDCIDLLNRVSDALNELWTKMADDGVKDVVYIQYSKDAGSTDDSVRGMQKPVAICTSGRIRCHSIDSTAAVMGELQDGIHPTRAANDRLAKVIYEAMTKDGVRR